MTLSLVFNQVELFMKKSGEGIYWEVAGKGRRVPPVEFVEVRYPGQFGQGPRMPKNAR